MMSELSCSATDDILWSCGCSFRHIFVRPSSPFSCQALPVRKAKITVNHAGLSFVCRCITSSYINYCRSISFLTEADQPGIALEYANTIDLNTYPC